MSRNCPRAGSIAVRRKAISVTEDANALLSPTARPLWALLEARVRAAPGGRLQRLLRDPVGVARRKLLPGRPCTLRTFWGEALRGVPAETVAATIMARGYIEENLTRALLVLVREGMTFVDVGAHIGYYTLLAARVVGERGRVLAIEPTPSTFELLHGNVAGRSNVVLRDCAAWSGTGTITLRDFGPRFSAFNSFTLPRLALARYREIVVEAVALDDELERQRLVPDIVKVDAESAERQVIDGMRRTLLRRRPVLTLEVGDAGIPGVMTTEELIGYVRDGFGYRVVEWRAGALRPLAPRREWSYDNLVFVPQERSLS